MLFVVQELRQAYIAESEASGLPRMTVSMAVPAGEYNIDLGYDVAGLSAYVLIAPFQIRNNSVIPYTHSLTLTLTLTLTLIPNSNP